MKIAIDISQIVYETGVSTYTKELVKNLLLIDKKNDYILFGNALRRRSDLVKFAEELNKTTDKSFKFIIIPFSPALSDMYWNRLRFTRIDSFIGKPDVLHVSDWTIPPTSAKIVSTIHDLVPILYPHISHPRIVKVHNRVLHLIKSTSSALIAPSKSTQMDLVSQGLSISKISVIPEAVSNEFKRPSKEKIDSTLSSYGIKGKYIFALGLGERKNTSRLITAFENLNIIEDMTLVVAGGGQVLDKWKRVKVKFIGHVKQADLPSLYAGCEAFVYPSIYEGFGLPILEAFSCEVPVVTSEKISTQEVAGDAAVLVNPLSEESITKGIKEAIFHRKSLVEEGKKRLINYSWEKTARLTLKVYNSA